MSDSIYSQGGSSPSTNTPAGWAAMISAYRTASRASAHGIPIIYGLDSVHGLGPVAGATVFPHNVGLGAIGDPAFIEEVTRVVADESAGVGADFPFAPVVAVGRDERWGRTYEAYAETPDLVSSLGVAMVKGLQYPTGGTKISILANIKHYLGDGGTALGVTGGPVTGDEAALRALHLAPYRATVAAHAGSVMLSYNTWQGVEMHINKPMITDVLKGELGFGGFVGTDYNGCFQVGLNTHDGLAACLNAGADMFMIFGNAQVPTADRVGHDDPVDHPAARHRGHGSDGAPRRRRPPHHRREVRDGPVRRHRRRSIRRRRRGSDRRSTGCWRGRRCRNRWSC